MQLFLFHFRLWGNTFEQNFLGARSLGTIEPQNLEVMLTNSEGWGGLGALFKSNGPADLRVSSEHCNCGEDMSVSDCT